MDSFDVQRLVRNRQSTGTPLSNGLFAEVWGEGNGIGVRSAVGMGSLPDDIPVEIEALLNWPDFISYHAFFLMVFD